MPEQHSFNADGTLRRGSPRNREKVYRISLSSKLRVKLMAQRLPAAISDWRYLAVSVVAGMITFWWPTTIQRLWSADRQPSMALSLGLLEARY